MDTHVTEGVCLLLVCVSVDMHRDALLFACLLCFSLFVAVASFNLGAESVADYGDYFGWGDVSYSLTVYDSASKYAKGKFNFAIAGDTLYDIAAKELGGHWRMPKPAEIEALSRLSHRFVQNYNSSGVNAWVLDIFRVRKVNVLFT